MGSRVFIAHAKRDRGFALRVHAFVGSLGLSGWIDDEDLAAGYKWNEQIVRAIEACDVMVVIVSAASVASDYVQAEAQAAFEQGKVVLPLRIEAGVDSRAIDLRLRTRQEIEIETTDDGDPGWENLRDALRVPEADAPPAPAQGWRWCSTPESAEALQPTVLALVETALATGVFVWIAIHWGTLHLAVSACVAPLLLLRTPESTAKGLEWAIAVANRCVGPMRPLAVGVLMLSVVLPTAFTVIKIAATVRSFGHAPLRALASIPPNWWRLVGCMDTAHLPEPVPGAVVATRRSDMDVDVRTALNPALELYNVSRNHIEAGEQTNILWRSLSVPFDLAFIAFTSALLSLLIIPSIAYRWSLKGSCLIYAPLLWVVRSTFKGSTRQRFVELRRLFLYKVILVYSTGFLLYFASRILLPGWWAAVVPTLAELPSGNILLAYLGPDAIPIWQFASAVNAAIAWTLFLIADKVLLHYPQDHARLDRLLRGLSLFRGFLSVYTIAVGIYIAASLVDTWSLPQIGTSVVPW